MTTPATSSVGRTPTCAGDRPGDGRPERDEDERTERVVGADARPRRLRDLLLEDREPEREVDRERRPGDDLRRDSTG